MTDLAIVNGAVVIPGADPAPIDIAVTDGIITGFGRAWFDHGTPNRSSMPPAYTYCPEPSIPIFTWVAINHWRSTPSRALVLLRWAVSPLS